MDRETTYTAFAGEKIVAAGPLDTLLPSIKALSDMPGGSAPLIFEDHSGRQVDFDLRGSGAEVLARALPSKARSGPGRPKLGVVSREVSLLPRHWEWLEQQPNGASAALRRLIDQARSHEPSEQRARQAKDAALRFMSAIAGNLPGYEEATRALYANDRLRFEALIQEWPSDIRRHVERMTQDAFTQAAGAEF